MTESLREMLTEWENFYVIVGSSGAALTGLQFVVMTLLPESRVRGNTDDVGAFGTPTIVHFGAVLLVSAIVSAPWRSVSPVATSLATCGVIGMAYTAIVTHRARFTRYRPVLEDWLFHVILPFLAYLTIGGAGAACWQYTWASLFGVAAAVLLLLFVGIHNAWDTVTYIATGQLDSGQRAEGERSPD